MKFLIALTVLLSTAVVNAQGIVPATVNPVVKNATPPAPQPAVPHPEQVSVTYEDLHRICPSAKLQQADVPHPYLPGKKVTVQFYAPAARPMIRQWPSKIVYDYGWHEVEIKYRGRRLVVDYDGPSRRSFFVGIYIP